MRKSRVKRRRSRARRWVERAFLLGGILGLGIWVWSIASRAIFQDWENWVFDSELRGHRATITGYLTEKRDQIAAKLSGTPPTETRSIVSSTNSPTERSKAEGQQAVPNNGLIGRLVIPRLHLSVMVREGVGEHTLRLALGHIPGTAFPGQSGNVGVAGHRDTFFRNLREIHQDDLIRLETVRGTYLYRAERTEIVSPRKVSVLNAGLYPELTLVTCFPFYYVGSAPDRFIVKARQVSESSQEQELAETPAEVAQPPVPRRSYDGDRKPAVKRVGFEVIKGHSRQLVPGVSIGLTQTDVASSRVDGWMWVMPDRRTIWLRDQRTREPVIFYGREDGKRREVVISSVTPSSMKGYLLLP